VADQSAAVTREEALAFADEAFRNRDITFSHCDVVDMTGALSTFLQRHRLGATAIASAEQSAATPWLAWPARKTWEEVRVRLRSRDGNEWEEIASDFEYWMQSADGEMCDDVVAFQIIGETPLSLASVSSASADYVLVPRKLDPAMASAGWSKVTVGLTNGQQEAMEKLWIALIDAAPTPEPVPATNQAGEVGLRDQLDKCAALLIDVLEADPGPKANAAYAAARKWWREYDAALATQPATSQEGAAVNGLHPAPGHADGCGAHDDYACDCAATPTPPTLSEDLRVLIAHAVEDAANDECLPSAAVERIFAALAQVKAS